MELLASFLTEFFTALGPRKIVPRMYQEDGKDFRTVSRGTQFDDNFLSAPKIF